MPLYLTILRGSSPATAKTVLAVRDQALIEEVTKDLVKRLDRVESRASSQAKPKAGR